MKHIKLCFILIFSSLFVLINSYNNATREINSSKNQQKEYSNTKGIFNGKVYPNSSEKSLLYNGSDSVLGNNSKRIKRNMNETDIKLDKIESLSLQDLFKYSSWENSQNNNNSVIGFLNLNQIKSNQSKESRPKYEITFRILPSVNKVYKEFENRYKNQFEEEIKYEKDVSITKNKQTIQNDDLLAPQTLVSNTSEVNETVEYLIEKFKEAYPVDLWRQYGWFTDEYLYIINDHWLKYPPQTKEAHYILAFVYLFVLAAGIFGNLLVIFMFFRCRSLRTPANILVVNLAFSDLLMMTELPMLVYNSIFEGPALGQTACTIYGFIGGLTGTVSIGTLSAIAFDRYSVVVYPLDPLRAITGLRAKLSVVFTWIYGIFFAVIPALDLGLGKYVPEGFLTSCSYDYLSEEKDAKIFIFAFFIAAWALPLAIISFCYAKIVHVVIITRNLGKEAAGKMSSRHCKDQEKHKTEVKLAGVVVCVIGLFFAAWTPYTIVSLMGIFGYKHLLKPIYSMVPAMCAKLASCLDPFVYVVTHPKFRQECENLFFSKAEQQRKSTMRQGYSENQPNPSIKSGRDNDVSSENEIEVVEMMKMKSASTVEYAMSASTPNKRGIGLSSITPVLENIKTISSHIVTKGIEASELPKSLEENEDLKPPSWYVKPDFARTNSVKNVVQKIKRLTSSESIQT